jgi:hypothetical protein
VGGPECESIPTQSGRVAGNRDGRGENRHQVYEEEEKQVLVRL